MVANRRVAGRHAGNSGEESLHVLFGNVDASAGSHGSGHRPAIPSPRLVTVPADLLAGQAEEPDQVGVRAEPAVPDSDRVLGRQSRRYQGMRDTRHGEGGDRKRRCLSVRAEQVQARVNRPTAPGPCAPGGAGGRRAG